jgi:subtilase family serine protease
MAVGAQVRRVLGGAALALLLSAPRGLFAQGFTVTPRTQAYVPLAQIPGITGVTAVTFADPDEDYQGPIAIGFRCRFLGATYTELGISTNGWIGFGPVVRPPDYINRAIPNPADPNEAIFAWWDDLIGGVASYGTVGAAPNRTFVIELQHFREARGVSGVDDGAFQVWLYEGLERFEVRFGGDLETSETQASSGFEGVNASPYGALFPCGKAGNCNTQDFDRVVGTAYRVERSAQPELLGTFGSTFPRGAAPGGRAMGPITIINQGAGTATTVVSNLYLSTDATLDASDTMIGMFTLNNVLGASTVTTTVTVTIPASMAIADYHLILDIDPSHLIMQPDPSVNVVVSPRNFATAADLAPVMIAPASMMGANAGQPITFHVAIQQNGIQYHGPVVLELFAAPAPIWDVSDPVLGQVTVNLSGALSENVDAMVTLPQLSPGHFYPIVLVDAPNLIPEYNEINNVLVGMMTFPTGPDFTIQSVTTPTTTSPGSQATMTTVIGSIGVPFSGSVTYRLYASIDTTLDASDAVLGTYSITFANDASIRDTQSVALPASLPANRYWVIAMVDPSNQIMELDETNNTAVSPMQIVDGYDFAVVADSVTFAPDTIEAGQMLTVSATIRSLGAPYMGMVPYRVYLSAGSQLAPTDVGIHDGLIAISSGDIPLTATFPLPNRSPAGLSQVTVAIDPDRTIPEADATNDASTSFDSLEVNGGDVYIQSMMGAHVAYIGEPYTIDLVIANAGPTTSHGLRYGYFLSATDIIRPTDMQIFMSGTTTIASGSIAAFTDVVTIPALTSTATRFVGVVLFPETPDPDLTNNTGRLAGGSTRVLFPLPDLTGRITASATSAAAGEPLAVGREIVNDGLAGAPKFDYAYYLSTDATVDAQDILLARFSGSLPVNGVDIGSDSVPIPSNVGAGRYYLGLVLDPDNRLEESDETNNVLAGPLVTVHRPDITFLGASLPDAIVNVPYQAGLYATGGPLPITWSLSHGDLPLGLTLDTASGLLSGTPAKEGVFSFTVRASSGTAYADEQAMIRVLASEAPLAITTTHLPPAIAGRDYAAPLVAQGGALPYTWTSTTDLPDGLSLLPSGVLSGRPLVPTVRALEVSVADARGATAKKTLALNVLDASQKVTIVTVAIPDAIAGVEYCANGTIRLDALGGVPPYRWKAFGALPPNMTVTSDGALCGVPDRAGSFPIIVHAEDQTGLFDTALVILEVASGSDFAVASTHLADAVLGAPYMTSIAVANGIAPYTISLVPMAGDLPPGLTLDPSGGINGKPTRLGLFSFAVEVIDAKNRTTVQPLSIEVVEGPSKGCHCNDLETRSTAGSGAWIWLAIAALALARRPRRTRIVVAGVISLLVPSAASAQTVPGTPYVRSTAAIAYRNLANPTRLMFANNDDGNVTVALPFVFHFYDSEIPSITVGTNGAILMSPGGNVTLSNHAPGDGNAPHGFVAPVWDDLALTPSATADIATESDGIAPQRTFTIEWRNVGRADDATALVTFSIRLFEGPGGRIEIDYGTPGGAGTYAATMGMEDPGGAEPILFSPSGCTSACTLANIAALANMRVSLVQDRGVDLAALAISTVDIGYVGSQVAFAETIANLHGQSSGPFAVNAVLGTSPALDDPIMVATATITLQPFETRAIDASFTIPATIATGAHWLGLIVDPKNRIQEVDEQNNRVASIVPLDVIAAKPDLAIISVVTRSSSVTAGRTVSVTSSIANIGGASVSGAIVSIMLSTNPVITVQDLELTRFNVSLDPGRAITHTDVVTIPAETATGIDWLGTLADPMNQIDELSKANNALATRTGLVVSGRGFAIVTSVLPMALVGEAYFARAIAGGGKAPLGVTWQLASGQLPAGLMIDSTGAITGTPLMPGTASFTIAAQAGSDHDSKSLSIMVVDPSTPLAIVTESLPPGILGEEYAFQLASIGAARDSTVAWSALNLPMGISISANGLLGGIPSVPLTSSIAVTAMSAGMTAMRTLVLRVVDGGVLMITPDVLEHAQAGMPFHQALHASGGLPPLVWTVDLGALPPGIMLTTDGALDGTPLAAGSYQFAVEVRDTPAGGSPERDMSGFQLVVDPTAGLTITTASLPDAIPMQGYDQTIHASGGMLPYRWTIRAGTLPDGLASTTNPMTGDFRISGQATAIGRSNLLIDVEDAHGLSAERAFTIDVIDGTAAPSSSGSRCGCAEVRGRGRAPSPGAWALIAVVVFLVRRRAYIRFLG